MKKKYPSSEELLTEKRKLILNIDEYGLMFQNKFRDAFKPAKEDVNFHINGDSVGIINKRMLKFFEDGKLIKGRLVGNVSEREHDNILKTVEKIKRLRKRKLLLLPAPAVNRNALEVISHVITSSVALDSYDTIPYFDNIHKTTLRKLDHLLTTEGVDLFESGVLESSLFDLIARVTTFIEPEKCHMFDIKIKDRCLEVEKGPDFRVYQWTLFQESPDDFE